MTDEYDPTAEPTVDLERVPFEVRRALEKAGYFAELLAPGLRIRRDDDGTLTVVDCHGDDLATVPLHRLLALDSERLRQAAATALERVPVDIADQCAAAINAGAIELHDPPDGDMVRCDIPIGSRVVPLFAAHRRVLVPGWPEDDPA